MILVLRGPVQAIRCELRETNDLNSRGRIGRDVGGAHNLLRAEVQVSRNGSELRTMEVEPQNGETN